MSFYLLHRGNQVVMFAVSGPSAKASEEDQERTRRLADAEMHRHHLESLLDQRDREITALREVQYNHDEISFCGSVFHTYKQHTSSFDPTGAAPSVRGNP